MVYISPLFRAGQHDFDGQCNPSGGNEYSSSQNTFSVGIFEYVTKKNGLGLKRGPVKVRVRGPVGALWRVHAMAKRIRDELDRGVYRGPKQVTVRENDCLGSGR